MIRSRRGLLAGGAGVAAGTWLASLAGCAGVVPSAAGPSLGFAAVPASAADRLTVPEGYVAQVLAPWGEPLGIAGAAMPAFRRDASNSAAEQALQMGMHHDGLQFFPIDGSSRHGLLVVNHEYVDDGLLHADGVRPWTAEKVAKAQAAHGISVIEVALQRTATGTGWQLVRPSRFARRITARTPCAIGGPAAGHALMRTAGDPAGLRVLGTLNNCGCGMTPWGTCLSGEENVAGYFATGPRPTAHERRYDLQPRSWSNWPPHDPRFDTTHHPNEPNRFGWVVELDPFDPTSLPVKRTALGRAAHEGAWVAVTRDRRAVVYSGEDARFERLYKFVSRDPIAPGGAKANATLLDHGTLYAARFDPGGRGRWLPLVHGRGPLTTANGFADQGEVVVKARQASDAVGASRMDRPEWLAVDAASGWVHCALTGNADRGRGDHPGADAANPRAGNTMGHVIRWHDDGDFDAETFDWNHLLLAGDPANARPEARGTIAGDAFACPDTLAFDRRGVLWIGTDIGPAAMHSGEMQRLGNNQLLACNPVSGEVRRFMVGPVGCELTGATFTPDGRTLFVDVQHPGEPASGQSDPSSPRQLSGWPDFDPAGRPRSATVAVRRRDGGVVGA